MAEVKEKTGFHSRDPAKDLVLDLPEALGLEFDDIMVVVPDPPLRAECCGLGLDVCRRKLDDHLPGLPRIQTLKKAPGNCVQYALRPRGIRHLGDAVVQIAHDKTEKRQYQPANKPQGPVFTGHSSTIRRLIFVVITLCMADFLLTFPNWAI
jgi:hypothetical protein